MADSIDAMKAELIEAGYTEDANLHWHWRGGNFGAYSATFPSIDSAYRHYEEGKRMAELEAHNARLLEVAREQQKKLEAHEAFVNDFDNEAEQYRKNAELSDRQDFSMFFGRAKALRGEE